VATLEQLQPDTTIRGIRPDGVVTVVKVTWFGSNALELTYKDSAGKVANELLYRHDEQRIEVVEAGRPWSFDGDGTLYPIHPEVFDRLYTDWSTLVKFQRTRGVLRLMAAVIHSLWERGDRNPLILPSTIPIDDPPTRRRLHSLPLPASVGGP
jgi:hypothetical protein